MSINYPDLFEITDDLEINEGLRYVVEAICHNSQIIEEKTSSEDIIIDANNRIITMMEQTGTKFRRNLLRSLGKAVIRGSLLHAAGASSSSVIRAIRGSTKDAVKKFKRELGKITAGMAEPFTPEMVVDFEKQALGVYLSPRE